MSILTFNAMLLVRNYLIAIGIAGTLPLLGISALAQTIPSPSSPAAVQQAPTAVQVLPPGGRVIISNTGAPSVVEVSPAVGTQSQPSVVNPANPAPAISTQPPAPTFSASECERGQSYVNLPQLGGGACLAPAQAQNLAF